MTRQILELCYEAEQQPDVRVSNQWWEREGVNLAETQQATAAAADMEEAEEATGEGHMDEVRG